MPGHHGVLRLHSALRRDAAETPATGPLSCPSSDDLSQEVGRGHHQWEDGEQSEGFSPRQGGERGYSLPGPPLGPWRDALKPLHCPGRASPPSPLPPVLVRVPLRDPRDPLESEPHWPLREVLTLQPAPRAGQSFRRQGNPRQGSRCFPGSPTACIAPGRLEKF